MVYIFLLVGFIILIKGADYFIEGASSVATLFRVSPLIIGLTVVAFGTSAPELAVSVTSALKEQNEICLGNVIGSNIFNLLVVIGISAIICPLKVRKELLRKEFIYTLLAMFFLVVLSLDSFTNVSSVLSGSSRNILSKNDGLMLLAFFVIFMINLVIGTFQSDSEFTDEIESMSLIKSIGFVLIGIIGVTLGADIVVNSSVVIAKHLGFDERIIGLTIVAIGTSLPELVASVAAARKGHSDMAIGNVLGSTIFNIVLIIGVSATINPIAVDGTAIIDLIIMVVAGLMTYLFSKSSYIINRFEGVVLLISYVLYIYYVIVR